MTAFFLALLGAALVNNLLVLLPAGADAVQARPTQVAVWGPASALLIALATPLGWGLFHGVLVPLQLDYLRLFGYVPLLAAVVWLTRLALGRSELAREPGDALTRETASNPSRARPFAARSLLRPWLVGSGAALGSILLAEQQSFVHALAQGIGGGLGFWLALKVFADLLERIDHTAVPAAFRGAPLLLICAGLLGLALLGLQGLAPQ
jgi:electron transport complex protein RnfA